jgi:hypothetical protein
MVGWAVALAAAAFALADAVDAIEEITMGSGNVDAFDSVANRVVAEGAGGAAWAGSPGSGETSV